MAFHLHRDGKAVQFDIDTLREMARLGDLRQDEYIYDDGKGEWIGAALVPEMAGAWNIEENEATVAMEIPPDFFDEMDAAAAAAEPEPEPEPEPAPAPPAPVAPVAMAPVAAAPEAPAPRPRTPAAPAPAAPQISAGGGGGSSGGFSGGGGRRSGNLPHGEWLNPVKVVLLTLVTCGIFGIIWLWKRINEINTFLGREEIKPMFFFLGFLCGPLFLLIYWQMIKALPEMGQKAGVQIEDRTVVLLLLLLCFPYGFFFLYQQDLNTIWEACGAQPDS